MSRREFMLWGVVPVTVLCMTVMYFACASTPTPPVATLPEPPPAASPTVLFGAVLDDADIKNLVATLTTAWRKP